MNIIKRTVSFLAVILLVLSMNQPVYGADTIKVGFFQFDGYHNIDENGSRSGYGYEFIQKMLRYSDATAEYVGYDKTWAEMLAMLEKGEIDVLTSAQKTPERETKFDFSEPIGTSAAILTVKAGNDKYIAGKYSTYNGMRVGVIEGNSRNDAFEEYAAEKGFTYRLVYYDDMETLTSDLQTGEHIDAIVTSNLRSINNEWVLDRFAISSFYAMVQKGNTKLLNQINYAIEQMNMNSVGWQDELYDKYYAGSSSDTISLNSAERDYLAAIKAENKKIRVIVNPDREPYSYVENDQVKGIIPEIFEEVANRLDIPYEYVMCTTREEYQELIKNGSVDVVLDGRNDMSAAEESGYKLTDPYMDLSYSVLERSDISGEIKSIAALELADTSIDKLNDFILDRDVIYYDSIEECVKAVKRKEADACYLYTYCAQMNAVQDVSGQLQSITLPEYEDAISFAVFSSDDYRLLTILNKGVVSVKSDYVTSIIFKNTDFSLGHLSLLQLLRRNPSLLTALMGLLALLLILVVYGVQKKKSEKMEQEKNRELERFIGYVCKANNSVMEINFKTNKAKQYMIKDEHVECENMDYMYTEFEGLHGTMLDEDIQKLEDSVTMLNIDEIIEKGEDRYFEYRMKENGEYRWYAVTMTGIPKDADHPRNVIVFKRDINEVKKKEEEINQTLRDALETANQASKSKGSFLSNMSHEIRTPLNAIIGYLSIAKDSDDSVEKILKCVDNCEVASRHLLQIINDILDMSSIESGKLKIAREDFDLKKEITDITTIFFQNAKAKGIDFETHVDNLTQEWVVGDQLRLNQVLMNLLSNAVKFTPEQGTVRLEIHQLNEEEDSVYIKFDVIDTGIGMSKEYMSRIFHPFEQENAGTAKKFGGSGLGLSITNNLVRMMGGSIAVQSEQNVGTTFTVTMLFQKSKMNQEKQETKTDYSHVRVLVVDDQVNECTYVKTMLKRCGVKSDTVTSGEDAVKRIKSRSGGDYAYDLCIIDWNMPNMNGGEVTRRIRTEFGSELPIIIATAYDITEFEEEARAAGANKIIAKPLFQSTLFDLLVTTFGTYDPSAHKEKKSQQLDLAGIHLLLAEDNPMNMDIAVTILEKTGVKVDQAVNGEEALNIFASSEPGTYDMILMDVQMPVMDGYEATREIRNSSHPEAKTIPIIAMTANAFAEDVAEALAMGMNAHIAKPINYDKLFDLLTKYAK